MTKAEQQELLTNFINGVRDTLLSRSERWPEEWDGHDLRELAAEAFEWERTPLMKRGDSVSKRRRKACHNAILVNNLY